MKRPHLPGLHLLVAFESAARLLSFKRAAEEIAVTPSALSQRITRLEQDLEVLLFERGNRRIRLTAAGTAYLHEVRQALEALASVSSRAARHTALTTVTLAMNSIVAQELVIPALPRLRLWDPGLEVNVRSRVSMKTYFADEPTTGGLEGGLRVGSGTWPQFEPHLIGRLETVPLCAPSLRAQLHDWDDLHRHTLYCARSRRAETLETFRHPATGAYPRQVVTFETLLEAARAVEAGMGVMSGVMPLMNRLVQVGRLATAVGPSRPMPESLWLLVRADCVAPARMTAVADWLVDGFENLRQGSEAAS